MNHASRVRPSPTALLSAACVFLIAQSQSAYGQAGVFDFGSFHPGFSQAQGVSADGSVVVGIIGSGTSYHGFRWSNAQGILDIGTLGGVSSSANGVSGDGSVVVGAASLPGGAVHAFRWTSSGGMVDLGSFGGGYSEANAVSVDGSVVVGFSYINPFDRRAFRWTNAGMVDLGTLGGSSSNAKGVSADGSVVVGLASTPGNAASHAFRWTSAGGMADLGTLGGMNSEASGVSNDGSVVVGSSFLGNVVHAFRWTSSAGMVDLGVLGDSLSWAYGVSGDGAVVVGESTVTGGGYRAFRWSAGAGMQSVEDWLRSNGVTVPADITARAYGTNADGSVVVGSLDNNRAFLARVSSVGNGLITLSDVERSLSGTAMGGNIALSTSGMALNGAHGRPLSRRVASGRKVFWLAGDWGRDDHGNRDGDLGLAEVGIGKSFDGAQANISLGQTWANQTLALNGRVKAQGNYLMTEALIPLNSQLWMTAGAFSHWGSVGLRRGYFNAGVPEISKGRANLFGWGARARLDLNDIYGLAGANVSPFVDFTYTTAKLGAYTETGGAFPARFGVRKDRATELRVGLNVQKPIGHDLFLLGTLEATHRFEKNGARTAGQLIGLVDFDLDGQKNSRNWLRLGFGIEGKLAGGRGSLSFNVTNKGEVVSTWMAAAWQVQF